ncbi:MAG TPA: endolytic transglycosylase MltG [Casimicrobiaceae bacterium]|nr:endolytic transglycosylase MltG [Casimicrobiaceae bacterium]
MLRRLFALIAVVLAAGLGAWSYATQWPLPLPQEPYALTIRQGASLRAVARELTTAGVLPAAWTLVALGRLERVDRMIKAGNYEIPEGTTLAGLLAKLSQGDVTQAGITIGEGWTFRDLKQALRDEGDVAKTAVDLTDAELMRALGAGGQQPEGWFFPDTYFFASGSTDLSILTRAYRTMRQRLDAAWATRASGLPFGTPYEALILASIVEKETGRIADRPLIASVLVNRLRQGMRLQADPTVIYGIGERFDGNLTKRDLDTDSAYNTYTRDGLPPTPIALPSQASLDAVLHPPATPYLYFVSRGDGSSEFSANLADHNRAVAKYQKNGR